MQVGYYVYNKTTGGEPTVCHNDFLTAEKEAIRLSKKHVGQEFAILWLVEQANKTYKVDAVSAKDIPIGTKFKRGKHGDDVLEVVSADDLTSQVTLKPIVGIIYKDQQGRKFSQKLNNAEYEKFKAGIIREEPAQHTDNPYKVGDKVGIWYINKVEGDYLWASCAQPFMDRGSLYYGVQYHWKKFKENWA